MEAPNQSPLVKPEEKDKIWKKVKMVGWCIIILAFVIGSVFAGGNIGETIPTIIGVASLGIIILIIGSVINAIKKKGAKILIWPSIVLVFLVVAVLVPGRMLLDNYISSNYSVMCGGEMQSLFNFLCQFVSRPPVPPNADLGPAQGNQPIVGISVMLQINTSTEQLSQQLFASETPAEQRATSGPVSVQYLIHSYDQEGKIVNQWLTSNGFKINYILGQNEEFEGTVTQIENAFSVQIDKYIIDGNVCYATNSSVQTSNNRYIVNGNFPIPSEFSSTISSISLPTCYPGLPV